MSVDQEGSQCGCGALWWLNAGSEACMARERLGCAEQEERDVANLIGKGWGCMASVHLRVQPANVYNCILAGMLVCSRLGALVRREVGRRQEHRTVSRVIRGRATALAFNAKSRRFFC